MPVPQATPNRQRLLGAREGKVGRARLGVDTADVAERDPFNPKVAGRPRPLARLVVDLDRPDLVAKRRVRGRDVDECRSLLRDLAKLTADRQRTLIEG